MTMGNDLPPEFPPIDWDMPECFRVALKKDDEPVCLQIIPDKEGPGKAYILQGTLLEMKPQLIEAQRNGCGIFLTINRTDGKGRRAKNVLQATAVFVDGDDIPLPTEWVILPHIIVQRDELHWHAYWLIEPTDDLAAWTKAQKRLANCLGTDPKICDPARVMRMPGFIH